MGSWLVKLRWCRTAGPFYGSSYWEAALTHLESNHYAISSTKSHGIKSLRKNTRGEGGVSQVAQLE